MSTKFLAVGIAALVAGYIVGNDEPQVTIKEVSKEVAIASPECLEALRLADQTFTVIVDALKASSDAMGAMRTSDVYGLLSANQDMERASTRIEELAPQYRSARDACQADMRPTSNT